MNKHDFAGRIGKYVTVSTVGEKVMAYVPKPLPPDPKVRLDQLYKRLDAANQAIGQLQGVASILPDTPLFLYMYVKKEALLSSQIEGTQSSLSELLMFERKISTGVPTDNVQEVSNYVAAMNHGLKRMRAGFPLSSRLIRELHKILLTSGRGSSMNLGEFRRSQNWIGGTRPGNARFVPPPPYEVDRLMSEFEKFIHSDKPPIPDLIKAGLMHVQFETIHPFLDGNGRLGRLLIALYLCSQEILTEPILFLSLYFKAHRQKYYELLQQVRETGEWEIWLEFFLDAIADTSRNATTSAHKILYVFKQDHEKIEKLGRTSSSLLRLHQLTMSNPVFSVPDASRQLNLSPPTIAKAARNLEAIGILRETTGKRRGKLYLYQEYFDILRQGTDTPAS